MKTAGVYELLGQPSYNNYSTCIILHTEICQNIPKPLEEKHFYTGEYSVVNCE